MRFALSVLLSVCLSFAVPFTLLGSPLQQEGKQADAQQQSSSPVVKPPLAFGLEDGTPVKLRTNRTVSSADAHVNDTLDFEVLEEVKVHEVIVIFRFADKPAPCQGKSTRVQKYKSTCTNRRLSSPQPNKSFEVRFEQYMVFYADLRDTYTEILKHNLLEEPRRISDTFIQHLSREFPTSKYSTLFSGRQESCCLAKSEMG